MFPLITRLACRSLLRHLDSAVATSSRVLKYSIAHYHRASRSSITGLRLSRLDTFFRWVENGTGNVSRLNLVRLGMSSTLVG